MSNLDQGTCSSFSSLELPVTHAGQMSFPADKSTPEQSLPEFRQQNFNFHFGAQTGTEVFGQSSFEGQDFQFTAQTDLESNSNLEFEPMCGQNTSERNFGQQAFCSDSNVVDLVDDLSAVKRTELSDSTKVGAVSKPTLPEKRSGPAVVKKTSNAVNTEPFFKKFTSSKKYDSVLTELKSVHVPDFVGNYVAQPKLNDTLRERLQKDTKSRQEKQLTSAILTLAFDERVSRYQSELSQLLKPVFKMLELTNEKSIDTNRLREALGSMITLIAALNGTCSSDRRQSVMNHYGILGETSNNVGKQKELFTDEFLTVHGFAQKKEAQKRLATVKNQKTVKRKRKGKQTTSVVPASEPDSGEWGSSERLRFLSVMSKDGQAPDEFNNSNEDRLKS